MLLLRVNAALPLKKLSYYLLRFRVNPLFTSLISHFRRTIANKDTGKSSALDKLLFNFKLDFI